MARRELEIIASDLHASAVRVIGDDPQRLAAAGGHALDAGLELWFAPTAYDVQPDTLVEHLLECAHRAEQLRRSAGSEVVLVLGSEMSLSCSGFIPGEGLTGRLATMTDPRTWSTPEGLAALAEGSERARATHREIAAQARAAFGGPITYAAGAWEDVEWDLFDIVSVDAYRDAQNAATYRAHLRAYHRFGKPVAVTEFGCCAYHGAAGRGGAGWMIVDRDADPAALNGNYQRDEDEQFRYLRELLAVLETENIDSAGSASPASNSPTGQATRVTTWTSPPTVWSPSSRMAPARLIQIWAGNPNPPSTLWPAPTCTHARQHDPILEHRRSQPIKDGEPPDRSRCLQL